jgi:hypothetical protein
MLLQTLAQRVGTLESSNPSARSTRILLEHLSDYACVLRDMGVPGDDTMRLRIHAPLERFMEQVRKVLDAEATSEQPIDLYRTLATEYAHVAKLMSEHMQIVHARTRVWSPAHALADFGCAVVPTEEQLREFAHYYATETRQQLQARVSGWK